MKPIKFQEANLILTKPKEMTSEECSSLTVFSNGKECISCWSLSDEELVQIYETKQIWLRVMSGKTQPPVLLQSESPFIPSEKKDG